MSRSIIEIPNIRIDERIVRARNGVLVRVRFAVAEIDGRPHVRIIDVLPVVALSGNCAEKEARTTPFCLPCAEASGADTTEEEPYLIISPYFPSLDFFTSQMTRAPSVGYHSA